MFENAHFHDLFDAAATGVDLPPHVEIKETCGPHFTIETKDLTEPKFILFCKNDSFLLCDVNDLRDLNLNAPKTSITFAQVTKCAKIWTWKVELVREIIDEINQNGSYDFDE